MSSTEESFPTCPHDQTYSDKPAHPHWRGEHDTCGSQSPLPPEASCPSCGESPMFRSVVHECCVEVQALRAAIDRVLSCEDYRCDSDEAHNALTNLDEVRNARSK